MSNHTVELEKLKSLLSSTQNELEDTTEEWQEKFKIEQAKSKEAIKKQSQIELEFGKLADQFSEEQDLRKIAEKEIEGMNKVIIF